VVLHGLVDGAHAAGGDNPADLVSADLPDALGRGGGAGDGRRRRAEPGIGLLLELQQLADLGAKCRVVAAGLVDESRSLRRRPVQRLSHDALDLMPALVSHRRRPRQGSTP
jgi:hypothetical protein